MLSNVLTLIFPSIFFSFFGLISWAACLILYIFLYLGLEGDENASSSVTSLSLGLFILHIIVLLLVLIDTKHYAGTSVFLQSLIIGCGSFITFAHASILGYIFAANLSNHLIFMSALSLACACLANAMMLALLFMLFHKTGEIKGAKPSQQSLVF